VARGQKQPDTSKMTIFNEFGCQLFDECKREVKQVFPAKS
jgi:hypothetical protein